MKNAFLIGMVVFLVALMATPVLAVPTQGQKLPVSLKFTQISNSEDPHYATDPGEFWVTNGGIRQTRDAAVGYKVEFTIEGSDTIVGYSIAEKPIQVGNVIKHQQLTIHESHIMYFPTEEGGFEGNALLKLTEYVSPVSFHIETHGTFHGSGAFEGQTIVASYEGPAGGTWIGYILKP